MRRKDCDRIRAEVIAEVNRIRTNPKSYIPLLEHCLENFDGNILTRPEKDECIETQEGPAPFKEAIEFLKNQRPIPEITFDEEASKVAEEYAQYLSKNPEQNEDDESKLDERCQKYLEYDFAISECIDYGGTNGKEVILNLLVDDGVLDRTHRENLFSTKFGYYGVGVGTHPEYEFCTVIDYFGDIISYKDQRKNKIFQEEKKLNKNKGGGTNLNKKYPPLPRKGFPSLGKKFNTKTQPVDTKNVINNNIGAEFRQTPSIKICDKTVSEYDDFDEVSNNENPFYDDEDAPKGCIKRKTKHHKKKLPNKTLITTVKIYTLEDGSEETVTIDEVIFDD